MPYGNCGKTGRNSQQAGGVPSTDDGFVGQDRTWKYDISFMGREQDKVDSLEASAEVAEDSEELGMLENNNHIHEHQSRQVENREEPNEDELAISASSASSPETVIIVDSQDVEVQGRRDPAPENLALLQHGLATSPHRFSSFNGSESAQGSKEGVDAVRDVAAEAPPAVITGSDHEELTKAAVEEEPDGDLEEVAEPVEEEPDPKRRRITPSTQRERTANRLHPRIAIGEGHRGRK